MNRFQKIAFTCFIILSVVLGYFGYQTLKNNKQPSVKAINLIPDSCTVLLTFDNYAEFSNSLRNKNLLWQDLRAISALNQFEKYLHYFDSLLTVDSDLDELADNNPVYFSVYKNHTFLISLNLKELSEEKNFREKLNVLFNPISALKLKAEIQDGVFGISNSENILINLFDRKRPKLIANKNFAHLNENTNYTGIGIYINYQGLLNQTFSSIDIKPESIALNGLSKIDSTLFFGDVKSEALTSFESLKKVPILCSAFEIFAVQNAEKLFSVSFSNDWWESVNRDALFNAKKQFYENISDYLISASLPSRNKALIIHISDSLKMGEILPFIRDTLFKRAGIILLKQNASSFAQCTFPKLHLNELKYLVPFNDHLVLAATEADAEIFLNANVNQSSILDNLSFRTYAAKNFDTEFHYLRYFLVNSLVKDQLPFSDILKNNDLLSFKNVSHCSYLSIYKNNFLNYRFFVKYFQEDVSGEPNLLWTLNADTTIITPPYLFKNHSTKGNELVFQNSENTICLLNATGKTLWKKKVSEAIRSEIFMVDAFKNGKYQLLFNTDNFLHLVDRNGNYVQGYPVKLPARATNKLSVLDYENKNELRLFIACADNKIYNFSIYGIKHEGYKPHLTTGEVNLPVKYCKVGLSDYLVTADKKGKIYAFSRKGNGRIDFKNKLLEDAADFELEAGNSLGLTHLVYFDDKNHLINKISLADKKEVFKTSEGNGEIAYCFKDVDKNKIRDVILAQKENLEVYNINGTKNYSIKPEILNPSSVNFYNLGAVSFITVFDKIHSKIAVITIEQNIAKEYSSTEPALICDLFNDGKPYLVVINGKQIKCYKL